MVALLLAPCTYTNLGRFLACYSEAVARISRDVKQVAGNLKIYENRICFHGDRQRNENSCIMLSGIFAVWL